MKQSKSKRRRKAARRPGAPRRSSANSIAGAVNLEEIHALLDLMTQRDVDEFELDHAGTRIRIKRAAAGSTVTLGTAAHKTEFSYFAPTPAAAGNPGAAVGEAPPETLHGEELHIIKSPIVGTFFAAPAPDAPPFVNVGDHIEAGQVLCIIEAMKLMNEIESDIAGEVVKIYVENGQPIEYGESLFAIHPAKKR